MQRGSGAQVWSRRAYASRLRVLQKKPINSIAILYDTANVPVAPWVKYLVTASQSVGTTVKSTDAFNIADGDCTSVSASIQVSGS